MRNYSKRRNGCEKKKQSSETKRKTFSFRFEAKNFEAKRSETCEKICLTKHAKHAKTKRNGSRFASFRFEAKTNLKRNWRTLLKTKLVLFFIWNGYTWKARPHAKTDQQNGSNTLSSIIICSTMLGCQNIWTATYKMNRI